MHTDCGGVAVNSFKQALHLSVGTAAVHDVDHKHRSKVKEAYYLSLLEAPTLLKCAT